MKASDFDLNSRAEDLESIITSINEDNTPPTVEKPKKELIIRRKTYVDLHGVELNKKSIIENNLKK